MKRLIEFDILRSLCAIWIVGVWHLTNYMDSSSIFKQLIFGTVGSYITQIVLAIFVFMSGLFIDSTKDVNKQYVEFFYKKKFLRLYLLYILSIITLRSISIPADIVFFSSEKSLLLSLFGLATFTGNAPATLWFLDMLFLMFLVTPLLILPKTAKHKAYIGLGVCFIVYLLVRIAHISDYRVLIYTPIYLLGLYMTPRDVLSLSRKYGLAALLLSCTLLLSFGHSFIITIIELTAGIFIGGGIALIINKLCNNIIKVAFQKIALCSMCAYLFHRQIYAICFSLGIWYCLYPIIAFVTAYLIQCVYNQILEKCRTVL